MLTIMDFLSSRLLTLLEHMLISNLRNLGEAIAYNLRAMFGLKVPIVTVVIGEGGSGGALAIGCSNKIFMLENAVFFVASPEACAAILWKTSQAAPKAAEKLRITATELCKLKIADGIIPEPLGGAHTDPAGTSQQIKLVVTKAMKELAPMDLDTLLSQRHMKFRILGGFVEGEEVDPEKKRNMKRKEADLSQITADIEVEIENLKKAVQDAKGKTPVPTISDEAVEKLKEEVDKEMTNAFISMGLQEKLEALKMELSKSPNASDQALNPVLKEKVDRLVQEFNHNLSRPGSFMSLKQKLLMFSKVTKLNEKLLRGEKLKKELNEKLRAQVKDQIEILRNVREKVAKGEKLEEQVMKEVEKAKEEIQNMLKSVNLEVVGLGRKARTAPPGLKDKLKKADDVIYREIDKAIDMVGLRWKIDELKAEIASGTNKEKAETLWNDIMEEISAVLDWAEVKKKVEIALNEEAESSAEEQVPETVSVGTNWG